MLRQIKWKDVAFHALDEMNRVNGETCARPSNIVIVGLIVGVDWSGVVREAAARLRRNGGSRAPKWEPLGLAEWARAEDAITGFGVMVVPVPQPVGYECQEQAFTLYADGGR